MRIVPYMPLFTTITVRGSSYWTAVASSWPVISKQPSGEGDDLAARVDQLGRDRGRQAVAHRARGRGELGAQRAVGEEAVDPAVVVAGPVGDDRVVGQPAAQPGHELGHLQRAGVRDGLAPGEVVG